MPNILNFGNDQKMTCELSLLNSHLSFESEHLDFLVVPSVIPTFIQKINETFCIAPQIMNKGRTFVLTEIEQKPNGEIVIKNEKVQVVTTKVDAY